MRKIQVNIKNLKNISKSHRKVPNWNMCFKVLYKCHWKKFENKKNALPSVGIRTQQRNLFAECQDCCTRQRQHVCRVLTASTRQRMTEGPPASPEAFCRGLFFAECLTLSKEDVCRMSLFAECLTLGKDGLCRVWHSANCLFTECPCFDTWQSAEHSAKSTSPVGRSACSFKLFHSLCVLSHVSDDQSPSVLD